MALVAASLELGCDLGELERSAAACPAVESAEGEAVAAGRGDEFTPTRQS
jgi:hypothetical protein